MVLSARLVVSMLDFVALGSVQADFRPRACTTLGVSPTGKVLYEENDCLSVSP